MSCPVSGQVFYYGLRYPNNVVSDQGLHCLLAGFSTEIEVAD